MWIIIGTVCDMIKEKCKGLYLLGPRIVGLRLGCRRGFSKEVGYKLAPWVGGSVKQAMEAGQNESEGV